METLKNVLAVFIIVFGAIPGVFMLGELVYQNPGLLLFPVGFLCGTWALNRIEKYFKNRALTK